LSLIGNLVGDEKLVAPRFVG